MRKLFIIIIMVILNGANAMAVEGLVTTISKFGPQETLDRLKAGISSHGFTVFAVVDHAKNAETAGLSLRFTTLLIFGNAKGGTPLMQANQTMGIDLPLKALVWQDAAGATWISYNDPVWLIQRHGLPADAAKIAMTMRGALDALAKSAAGES